MRNTEQICDFEYGKQYSSIAIRSAIWLPRLEWDVLQGHQETPRYKPL